MPSLWLVRCLFPTVSPVLLADLTPARNRPAQNGAEDWRKAITISTGSDLLAAAPSTSLPAPSSPCADSTSLAPLLCYSCLLIMQGTLPAPRGAPTTTEGEERKTVVLPPYVEKMARRRWRIVELAREQEGEVVGRREVKGEEGLRRQVEGYLLAE
jgi:hypothetical protein